MTNEKNKTTLWWTTLPGIIFDSTKKTLNLSVMISPRLTTVSDQGELKDFPKFISGTKDGPITWTWPETVTGLQFQVEIDNGSTYNIKQTDIVSTPNPEWWKKLFAYNTKVKKYKSSLNYLEDRKKISYPIKQINSFLNQEYQKIALRSYSKIPDSTFYSFNIPPTIQEYKPIDVIRSSGEKKFSLQGTHEDVNAFLEFVDATTQKKEIKTKKGVSLKPERLSPMEVQYKYIPPKFEEKDEFTYIAKASNGTSSRIGKVEFFIHDFIGDTFFPENQIKSKIKKENLVDDTRSKIAYLATTKEEEQFMNAKIENELNTYKVIRPNFQPHANNSPPQINDQNSKFDFYRVEKFHEMLSKNGLRKIKKEIPILDFHQIIGRLSQYPHLLRSFGIVIDFEIPIDEIPLSPYKDKDNDKDKIHNIRVKTLNLNGDDENPVHSIFNWAAYIIDVENKLFFTSPKPDSSEIENVMLKLDHDKYEIVSSDIDSSAIKLRNFSCNTARKIYLDYESPDSSSDLAVPSLSSAGFSIAKKGRDINLHERFKRFAFLNETLKSDPDPGRIFFAEDLVRGYIVDVWDSLSNKWHSLCLRKGTYNFTKSSHEHTYQYTDEGFISTTISSPTENGDIHLPETLFRWTGWGLSIRPVGDTIGEDGEPINPTNSSQDIPFKLDVSFEAVKKSLPRLRFGEKYQFRMRM